MTWWKSTALHLVDVKLDVQRRCRDARGAEQLALEQELAAQLARAAVTAIAIDELAERDERRVRQVPR